ncbi:hypothetical protein KCTC52924_00591 [Arenibacter antarcticus]|uniref:Uncharacterized protein n=1 Tax=Arenibacter antarcticus TaxID=2040469 RepID=A0ABW5VFP7_9FLAO|nr:hypothetical protein [Arenibacter sp. H213]MCM4169343.1 hypothetical protein [Arenibacter sp. H213]
MSPTKQQIKEFYQCLGKLFYAIAMADKKIMPNEIDSLRKDVKRYWLAIDDSKDEFGTDAAFQIEIVFDWLQDQEKEGDEYFTEFMDFYEEHPNFFSPQIKKLIWKTADDIASSYAHKNKSELILLNKLKITLS